MDAMMTSKGDVWVSGVHAFLAQPLTSSDQS